jgi:hypothetical protein
MFLFATGVPIIDYLLGTFVLGFHLPLLTLLTAIGYPIWRARHLQQGVLAEEHARPARA